MGVNATSNVSGSTSKDYGNYASSKVTTKESDAKKQETAKVEKTGDAAVVYDKNEQSATSSYTVNKMSKEQRDALIEKLKADQEQRQTSLMDIARDMIAKQAQSFSFASDDDVWRFLAKGKYEVDAATKEKAQKDIAEDGYYGVKQTSQRLFDFACALAGDDVDKMQEMQKAIEKGYKKAEKTWGGKLPEICQQTLEATNKMFDDYYASKTAETE